MRLRRGPKNIYQSFCTNIHLYHWVLWPVGRPAPLECSADPALLPPPPQVNTAGTLAHNPQAGQALACAKLVQAFTKGVVRIPP